jgi:hypothetical protein
LSTPHTSLLRKWTTKNVDGIRSSILEVPLKEKGARREGGIFSEKGKSKESFR